VHPLRAWADDVDDEECVILEVLTPFPLFSANYLDPDPTGPDSQASEGAASLAAARSTVEKTSTRKCGRSTSGASGAPPAKRTKVKVSGKEPPCRDQPFEPKAPPTSTGYKPSRSLPVFASYFYGCALILYSIYFPGRP
jgi:hypothetical protein